MSDLNTIMEFDHVIHVHADGTITEPREIWAPDVHVDTDDDGQILADHERTMRDDVTREGWSLLTGYTGQHGYRGPIMHPSEYVGGRLARDILDTPGYYVAVVVNVDDDEPAGWAVAYREARA